MLKPLIAISGLLIVVVAASNAPGKDLNLNRTAKSGVDSPLAYSSRWDSKTCSALPYTVTIAQKPSNGTASVVDAEETLPASTPGSGNTGPCVGKTIKSHKIMYLSKPNFRGSDVVVYEGKDERGTVLIHATINVTVQ
jgi:hypothetical protein